MKLYDVPNGTKIRVIGDAKVPPAAPVIEENDVLFFEHIDGMYSYCKDKDDNVVHLVAWAEVEIVE